MTSLMLHFGITPALLATSKNSFFTPTSSGCNKTTYMTTKPIEQKKINEQNTLKCEKKIPMKKFTKQNKNCKLSFSQHA
jgi:hypothetical protein